MFASLCDAVERIDHRLGEGEVVLGARRDDGDANGLTVGAGVVGGLLGCFLRVGGGIVSRVCGGIVGRVVGGVVDGFLSVVGDVLGAVGHVVCSVFDCIGCVVDDGFGVATACGRDECQGGERSGCDAGGGSHDRVLPLIEMDGVMPVRRLPGRGCRRLRWRRDLVGCGLMTMPGRSGV